MKKTIEKKIEDSMMECYIRLFSESTPQGDFEKMVSEAEVNERGQKVIPFDQYEIEREKMDSIIEEVFTKSKLPKYYKIPFTNGILLGCSPKTKN